MVRRQDPSVVGEHTFAAVVRCLPRPGTVSESQGLSDRVPRMVKKVGSELIGRWIVSVDLQSWCSDSLTLSKPSADEYVEPVECAGT